MAVQYPNKDSFFMSCMMNKVTGTLSALQILNSGRMARARDNDVPISKSEMALTARNLLCGTMLVFTWTSHGCQQAITGIGLCMFPTN
jgi:hypothetical protein